MKIRREPPSEMLEYRINAPLKITIGTDDYRTRDWSLEGFTVANFAALQASNAPIIGVASRVSDDLLQEAEQAGMAAARQKPVNKQELHRLLDDHVRQIDGSTPSLALNSVNVVRSDELDPVDDKDDDQRDDVKATTKHPPNEVDKKQVLFVISNEAQRSVNRAYAQTFENYAIDFAENCRDAVLLSGRKSYDLIILEMNDPKLRGSTAAQRIRTLQGYNVGEEFECDLQLPFQGYDIGFAVRAKVEGYTAHGEMRATFIELDERSTDILSFFAEELIRGSMTTIDDVILHLDRPVELVSQSPETKEADLVKSKPVSPKMIAFSMFYLVIGALVVAYTYLTINANFMQLEIEAAVVNAPLESLLSPTDGKIASMPVAPGGFIRKSGGLAIIESAALEEKIELARIEIERMLSEFAAKAEALAAEKDRYRNYGKLLKTEIDQAEANVKSLAHRTKMALNQKKRFLHLLERGFTTLSKVGELSSDHAALLGELEQAKLHLKEKQSQIASLVDDAAYSNKGRLKDLAAEVGLFETRITLAEKALDALVARKHRMVVTAPTNGRIVRALRSPGNTTKKGEEIIIFERDEARTVLAYLTQEEIIEVGLDDEVLIYFPSIDTRAKARVASIDRTEGYVDEMRAQYSWRGTKDRTALVTLSFVGRTPEEIRQSFPPGLPAIVIFERRDTNEIRQRWKSNIRETFQASLSVF